MNQLKQKEKTVTEIIAETHSVRVPIISIEPNLQIATGTMIETRKVIVPIIPIVNKGGKVTWKN